MGYVGSPHQSSSLGMQNVGFRQTSHKANILPPQRQGFDEMTSSQHQRRSVRRARSLVLLAILPGLLTCVSLLSCFVSSLSLLARASCNLVGSAHSCEFTFMLRKFAEPARSCYLQPCQVCSPVRVYFHASQVRRACSLVLAILPGLLTCASLFSCFASSPSLLARASCNLAESAHQCEFTFMLRKFAEPASSCFLQSCWVCSPLRVYFHSSQVRRACSLVLLATLPGLLTRASLLSCFATCSLVLLAILPGLLTRASLLLCFASSPSLLARASCNLAGSAYPYEFTFMLRKFAEPACLCFLQSCPVCSPVRVYFHASHVGRAYSLGFLQPRQIGSIRDSFRKTPATVNSGGQAVRVDSITLGPNYHYSHLRRSVRSREPLTLPHNSIGRLCGDVRPDLCQTGLKFWTCSVFRDLCRDVWVDPITLGPNDHHSHLRGSVRSQEPLTLPQNSIGNFRGDVRPDLYQSGLFSVLAGSVCAFRVRIQKIFLDHFRANRPVLWLFRGSCTTLDDLGNWSTSATGRGGPHCDVSPF
ncbi:hypothetical protein CRG98_019084 [Punica granatum]|uniref:Transmembrane protein n=1 Tax=Punica granatum TaxID=22663 RepID=A0A2I0JWB1_PUNGR|nr:hypothetical protein CRG98_019084 [Punica granatum]